MKKTPFFLILLFALTGFGFNPSLADAPSDDAALCSTVILSGCVGACGGGFSTSTTAPVSGLYCFDASSSLCPTHGAKVSLRVGGSTVFVGDVSGGTSFGFWAGAGQTIELEADLFEKKTNIVCVWLGEVNIEVRRP